MQTDLFQMTVTNGPLPAGTPGFSGSDFDPARDAVRLYSQIKRLEDHMRDGAWRTVSRIALELTRKHPGERFPENSVQAQLRNLRKPVFGGYTVTKRRVYGEGSSLWEYRITKLRGR